MGGGVIHIVNLNQFNLYVYPTVVRGVQRFKLRKYKQQVVKAGCVWCSFLSRVVLVCSPLACPHVACEKGLCRPQLSVITGRGNHSQGGVARIRPAVINYLTNAHYR